jgi:PmbA protein
MSLPVSAACDVRRARLSELVEATIAETRRQGASAASATVTASTGLSVTVRMGELETIEHHRGKHLLVTVYFGHKTAHATTTDFSGSAIEETVRAACHIAAHTEEDPCAGLADADRMANEIPDLDLFHPWNLAPEAAIDLALEAETSARDLDRRITNSDGALVNLYESTLVYGNTHGFVGGYDSTRHGISCTVVAEAEGQKQRDHWHTVSRNPSELAPAAEVGTIAARRALDRLGARKVQTCSVPVVFAPDQAIRLFRSFVAAIRGSSLYREASFLLDHLGKQVFSSRVAIAERAHIPGALGSSPFDAEGVRTDDRELVTDGVLHGYVLDSYAARKLGMQSTGNSGGIHNLIVRPGEHDLAGLLATMGTGLLVTELLGMGVNIVTGDYSRGAAGFWVEGGEIKFPVEEITIAGNLRDMFLGVQALGRDVDVRSNIRTGSVLIDRMIVAGD